MAQPGPRLCKKLTLTRLVGVSITFLQTSLDRKRAVVSWNDGKGMRFLEARQEAEQVGAEEQARQSRYHG